MNGATGTATAIAAGHSFSCAIQAGTGKLICWGTGGLAVPGPPAAVDGTMGTASAVALGEFHCCAIQAGTGKVVCWGDFNHSYNYGQATPPASVDGTAGTASAIAAGTYHTLAIRAPEPESSLLGAMSGAVLFAIARLRRGR